EAAAGRGRQRALERQLAGGDRVDRALRQRILLGLHRAGAGRDRLPLEPAAGRLDGAQRGPGDLRPDAVPLDERDHRPLVAHGATTLALRIGVGSTRTWSPSTVTR